eukprot:gene12652-6552_t
MKIAVVTGAGRKTGIGYEVVKGLLQNSDFHVILTTRNKDTSQEIVNSLEKAPTTKGKVEAFIGDLNKEETISELVSVIKNKFEGKIDILVNNAGILGPNSSFLDVSREDMLSVFETNTVVPLRLCQEF